MHELSIAVSLVETVCEQLPQLGCVRVRAVRIRVGSLSGVAPDALEFAFEVASQDSAIAGAALEIEKTHGTELELAALEVLDDDAADC